MSTRYLSGVRNITPLRSQSSYLDDYALVMGLVGPNFIEPIFANLKPCKGGRVEGVVHEITESDMARVIASEGENYEVIEAPIRFAGETVLAQTLRCKNEVNDDLPTSRRYMRILLKAARQNNLSAGYIEALLDGVEFRGTVHALDRNSRRAALDQFLQNASGDQAENAEAKLRHAA